MKQILRRGFTLIEVVMVIVIVGILAGLAIPRIQGFYSVKFNTAMKKVVLDIRYAQQIAVSRHTNATIIFYAGNDTYIAQEEFPSGSGAWQSIKDPFTQGVLMINFGTNPQYGGIDITNANFGGTNSLRFSWQGAPLSGGQVDFSYKAESKSIIVEQNTARVRVE